MKVKTVLALAGVVLVPFILYWSFAGFRQTIPDFQGSGSWESALEGGSEGMEEIPAPPDYDPDDPVTWDAKYARFQLAAQLWPVYISDVPTSVKGSIVKFTYTLSDVISPDEGKVYEFDKLTWHPPPPQPTVGEYWCKITVTGPGGYSAWWEGDHLPLLADKSPTDPAYYEVGSGRCFFAVEGKYYATGTIWAILDVVGVEQRVASATVVVIVDF